MKHLAPILRSCLCPSLAALLLSGCKSSTQPESNSATGGSLTGKWVGYTHTCSCNENDSLTLTLNQNGSIVTGDLTVARQVDDLSPSSGSISGADSSNGEWKIFQGSLFILQIDSVGTNTMEGNYYAFQYNFPFTATRQ